MIKNNFKPYTVSFIIFVVFILFITFFTFYFYKSGTHPIQNNTGYKFSRVIENYNQKLSYNEIEIKKKATDIVIEDEKKNSKDHYYENFDEAYIYDSFDLKYYSNNLVLLHSLAPKDCGGVTAYLVDIENKKVISYFSHSGVMFFVHDGYFFLSFSGRQESLGAYKYGENTYKIFNDSKLEEDNTYYKSNDEMCGTIGPVSTTTNSLKIDFYRKNEFDSKSKEFFKKIGERAFFL